MCLKTELGTPMFWMWVPGATSEDRVAKPENSTVNSSVFVLVMINAFDNIAIDVVIYFCFPSDLNYQNCIDFLLSDNF